jgi:FMN phosphatase YigB (HAD superfamily)
MTLIAAVDFDGVIHDFKNPVPHRRMGPPLPGAKEGLEELRRRGYELVIFTVWGDEKGQKTISDFMNYYELPFDSITNIKPNAAFYLDDKAVRFTDWNEALRLTEF